MKHLIIILALTFTFGLESFGQKINNKQAYQSILKKCKGKNVDAECVYHIKEKIQYDETDGTFFFIPDTFESKRSKVSRNGYWEYVTPYKAMMDYIDYCSTEKIDCHVQPEHPGVDVNTEMIFNGDQFDHVPVKEGDARDEPWSIESGEGSTFNIQCDVNNPSSLCQQMKEMKAKSNVQKINKESGKYRNDLADIKYHWEHTLNEFPKGVSLEIRSIDEFGPDPMINVLEQSLGKLYALRDQWERVENRF